MQKHYHKITFALSGKLLLLGVMALLVACSGGRVATTRKNTVAATPATISTAPTTLSANSPSYTVRAIDINGNFVYQSSLISALTPFATLQGTAQSIPFPRSTTTATILGATDANYADLKAGFASIGEYKARYGIVGIRSDNHLTAINAAAAYARGATGAGQKVLTVDTGIRTSHREFSGKGKVTLEALYPGISYNPTGQQQSHGTFVAALIAGNRGYESRQNMHGVAPDAKIHFAYLPIGTSDGTFTKPKVTEYNDAGDAVFYRRIVQIAETSGSSIVNLSFGVPGAVSLFTRELIREKYAHVATSLAQAQTANADKKIIVWAAGNTAYLRVSGKQVTKENYASPDTFAGLGAYFPKLQPHVLAVVALNQAGAIDFYSNHCGIAKAFCLAAPGGEILSAAYTGDNAYGVGSGTSFAAPIVVGSLALIKQYFRDQLGSTELVTRLLATANRSGRYADSDTYGHGLLDLDAATAPVGVLMSSLPGDALSRPLADSGIKMSPAFGPALQQRLANVEMAGFDQLGAPFWSSAQFLAKTATTRAQHLLAQPNRHSSQMLSLGDGNSMFISTDNHGATELTRFNFGSGWWLSYGRHAGQSLGLSQSADAGNFGGLDFAPPYLALVGDGGGLGWSRSYAGSGKFGFSVMHGGNGFGSRSNGGIATLLSMVLPDDNALGKLSLQAGITHEFAGFLGATTQGALGVASASTSFVGVNGAWVLGDDTDRTAWRILASSYFGRTQPQFAASQLLDAGDDIISSAFSVAIARSSLWQHDDWFGLRLSQPLRSESGKVNLRLASGRSKYGTINYQTHRLDLSPNGRALQAEAIYRLPFTYGMLQTTLGLSRHRQHDNRQGLQPFAGMAFVYDF